MFYFVVQYIQYYIQSIQYLQYIQYIHYIQCVTEYCKFWYCLSHTIEFLHKQSQKSYKLRQLKGAIANWKRTWASIYQQFVRLGRGILVLVGDSCSAHRPCQLVRDNFLYIIISIKIFFFHVYLLTKVEYRIFIVHCTVYNAHNWLASKQYGSYSFLSIKKSLDKTRNNYKTISY